MKMSKGARKRRLRAKAHQELLGAAPLVVGLDLAKKTHVAAFVDRERTLVAPSVSILHSRIGVQRLMEHAEKLRRRLELEKVVYFMESTGAYWMNVAAILEESGLDYRLVQGLAVHHERKIRDSTRAKDDLRDAEIVAHLGTTGRVVATQLPKEDLWIEMGSLAAERHELEKRRTADLARMGSFLRIVLPEIFEVFCESKGLAVRALAKSGLMTEEIRKMSLEDFIASVRKNCSRRGLYVSKLKQMWYLLKGRDELFGVDRLSSGIRYRIRNAAHRLDLYETQKIEAEKRLEYLYKQTPYHEVLESFPGVSSMTQVTTLGLMGDPRRLPEPASAVKLAGLDVPARESGQSRGKTEISCSGRPRLRYQAVKIGRMLMRFNADFRAFVEHLQSRNTRRLTRRQLEVACGAKYLRIFTAMCQTGRAYRSSMVLGKTRPANYRRFELQFAPGGVGFLDRVMVEGGFRKQVETIAEL